MSYAVFMRGAIPILRLAWVFGLAPAVSLAQSETNRLSEASVSLDRLIQPVQVQTVKSYNRLVTKSTNVEPFDLRAALPGIAKLLQVDRAVLTNVLSLTNSAPLTNTAAAAPASTGQKCQLSDVALAGWIAQKTRRPFEEVLKNNPERNWIAALKRHNIPLCEAVEHLEYIYMEVAFLKFDQRTNKKKSNGSAKP